MDGTSEIVISKKAQEQLRAMLDSAEKLSAQINTYAMALGAGMEVPEGWQLDIKRMTFVAPVTGEGVDNGDNS